MAETQCNHSRLQNSRIFVLVCQRKEKGRERSECRYGERNWGETKNVHA